MGESNKKTNLQVAPAVSAVSGIFGTKGKRDAENVLDKPVVAKKQKTETEMVVQEEDIKKLEKAQPEVPSKRKPETSSSDYDISSNSEEEGATFQRLPNILPNVANATPLVKIPPKKQSKPAKACTKESGSIEDSSLDDEPAENGSTPIKNGAIASRNGSVGAVTQNGEESSNSISDSDEDKEGASEGVKKQTAPDTKLEKKEESSPSESDTNEGDASIGSSCSEESSEKFSDVENEDEKQLKISKDKDVKVKSATVDSAQKQTTKMSGKPVPKTPLVENQTSGSQTLFVGNLSYDVGREDLSEFFKPAGEVVAVRLATRLDGSFKGFGHIDFATEDDVKKALELNGQKFFRRALRLEVARERGSHTPQSGKGKDGKGPSYTIVVKGFDKSLGEDQIRNSLQEHFGSCGGITRISILKGYESGALEGIAYLDFEDQDAYNKAFDLNGSELGEYTLTVDEAKRDNSNDSRDGGGGSGEKFGTSGGRGERDFSSRGRGRRRSRHGRRCSRKKTTTLGND